MGLSVSIIHKGCICLIKAVSFMQKNSKKE